MNVLTIIALTTAVMGALNRDARQLESMPLAPPPTILEPVVEALGHLEKSFRHIINLTTKKPEGTERPALEAPKRVSLPTARDICELGVRVRMLGEYLHPDARSTHDKAYSLQQTACEQMTHAYKMYDNLMRAADSAPALPERKAIVYTMLYMKTRQADARSALGKPLRRSQEEWERLFLANKPTQLHATEASWVAAIKDASEEADEASDMFREVTRLLREATQMEVLLYRQDKLLHSAEKHKSLLYRYAGHIRGQNEFGNTIQQQQQPGQAGRGVAPFPAMVGQPDAATNYDEDSTGDVSMGSDDNYTITQELRDLELALKEFIVPELEYRGKKVRSRADVFDDKLETILEMLYAAEENIRRVEVMQMQTIQ